MPTHQITLTLCVDAPLTDREMRLIFRDLLAPFHVHVNGKNVWIKSMQVDGRALPCREHVDAYPQSPDDVCGSLVYEESAYPCGLTKGHKGVHAEIFEALAFLDS